MAQFPLQGLVRFPHLGTVDRLPSKLCQGMGILIMGSYLSFQKYRNPCWMYFPNS